jgi:ribose transport system permease protein
LAVRDDSRIRVPTDVDIAPDGTIFFGEGSVRYDHHNWLRDALEGRGNGALMALDPGASKARTIARGLPFCAGVCVSHCGAYLYVSLSWSAAIFRYHISGDKAGLLEPFVTDLPGYPMTINRASDGGYWVALPGLRSPAYNLAMRRPRFRKRMTEQLPADDWLAPNFNVGLVLKFNDQGEIVESLWDPLGRNHYMVTSVREDGGYLYLGSWNSMKFGRKDLANNVTEWSAPAEFWARHAKAGVRA